jgi:hypothetical protein
MSETCEGCLFATRVPHSVRYEHICWYDSGMAVTRLWTNEQYEYPPACVNKMIEDDEGMDLSESDESEE